MGFYRALEASAPVWIGVAVGSLASILVGAPLILVLEALIVRGLHLGASTPQVASAVRLHAAAGVGSLIGGLAASRCLWTFPRLAHLRRLAGVYSASVPLLFFGRLMIPIGPRPMFLWTMIPVDLLFVALAWTVGRRSSRRV